MVACLTLMFLKQIYLTSSLTCGFSPSASTPVGVTGPLARESSYTSIRITPVFGNMALAVKYQDSFKYDIVNGALTWFANSLSVKRLINDLTFPNLGGMMCGGYNVSVTEAQTGYADTDVLVYINVYTEDSQTTGSAFTCAWDDSNYMPLVGAISFYLPDFESHPYELLYSTMVHQLTHILVFNSNYFSNFQQSNGTLYTYGQVVATSNERNSTVNKISTPEVVKQAQNLFNCASLEGLELDDSLTHWQKRLMNDEFMVIDSEIHDIVYSSATLGLFTDSGWYQADYTYASVVQWGNAAGCLFTSQKCVINQVATSSFFNTDINNERCSYDYLNKGKTNIVSYTSNIPAAFQYFALATTGGDQYADYCPFIKPNVDGDCRGLGAVATSLNTDYGENVGVMGRCLEGNFTLGTDVLWHATCHNVTCHDSWVDITIGDTVVSCPFSGGFMGVTGYTGFVDCDYAGKLCNAKPCPNACSGLGICSNGVCHCSNGDVGGDCQRYSWMITQNSTSVNGESSLFTLSLFLLSQSL